MSPMRHAAGEPSGRRKDRLVLPAVPKLLKGDRVAIRRLAGLLGRALPGAFLCISSSVKVMQHAIMTKKLRGANPTIHIVPRVAEIRALECTRCAGLAALPAEAALPRSPARGVPRINNPACCLPGA